MSNILRITILKSTPPIAIWPARVRKPRDKAKVEGSVLVAEWWILAHLRNQRFFSLDEANRAIAELLHDLNRRAFKKLTGCRHSVFIELDQPALHHLPQDRYQYAEWKTVRTGIDYHVETKEHYYSVPYRFAKLKLDARYTAVTVEVFHRGKRISAYARSFVKGKHTTLPPHMPPEYQAVTGWDANRLLNW